MALWKTKTLNISFDDNYYVVNLRFKKSISMLLRLFVYKRTSSVILSQHSSQGNLNTHIYVRPIE